MNKALLLLLPSAIAAAAYGAIAYYVNSDHGVEAARLAAITQAIASAVVTLCSTYLMQWMFSLPERPMAKFIMASAGSGALITLVFVFAHLYMKTPDIFETLAPSFLVGTPYFIAVPWMLYKQHISQTSD